MATEGFESPRHPYLCHVFYSTMKKRLATVDSLVQGVVTSVQVGEKAHLWRPYRMERSLPFEVDSGRKCSMADSIRDNPPGRLVRQPIRLIPQTNQGQTGVYSFTLLSQHPQRWWQSSGSIQAGSSLSLVPAALTSPHSAACRYIFPPAHFIAAF